MEERFYLIDFENVHDDGLKNINTLTESDHVHIFFTKNANRVGLGIFHATEAHIDSHEVPAGGQSLDMHLVSYLGYLLGKSKEGTCSYIIVSKDKDYDNIIAFWREKGIKSISREEKIPGSNVVSQKKTTMPVATTTTKQTINSKIKAGMAYELYGDDRSELNEYMQHGLIRLGYPGKTANSICKCVVAHCNDERMLSEIYNDLKEKFKNYSEVYEAVKTILERFASSKSRVARHESKVRSFFDQHFREKIYVDKKEEIINIVLSAKTRQQVNNELMKLYRNGNQVKEIIEILQPLIGDLPGK